MKNFRSLNKNGTDNIDRSELRLNPKDLYHQLLSLKWIHFFLSALLAYLLINLLFSIIYFLLGPDGFQGILEKNGMKFFEECFFFSIQTFSTIGYGRVAPISFWHNTFVSIEAFFGMLSVAVMSGILFSRFSRPTSKIKFSEIALITEHRGKRSFIFRMANARLNQIAEATLSVAILINYKDENGQMRIQQDLPLIRNKSLIFSASWTAVHVIDENSPFYEKSLEDLKNLDAEIIVSISGVDSTFTQTIHARHSYIWSEIILDKQFVDIFNRSEKGIKILIDKISDVR
jgi:inward rectifier potassium channel